jgi:hypothetical protein
MTDGMQIFSLLEGGEVGGQGQSKQTRVTGVCTLVGSNSILIDSSTATFVILTIFLCLTI